MKQILGGTLLSLAVACSSTGGRPRPPGPGAPPDAAVEPSSTAPSERECDDLIGHAIAIRIAEMRQTVPADQLPTEAEQAALRGELRASFLPACREGSREGYQCAMAARTLAELDACQATPSSSTSNSSVAPGGITPPAPRSP